MIIPNFWEISASGKYYSREYVLDVVTTRFQANTEPDTSLWSIEQFTAQQVGPDTYVTHYLLKQGHRDTWRTGIWRLTSLGWQIVYHQGTIVLLES